MNSLDSCNGVKRIQCLKCNHYFNFCLLSPHRDSVCPGCEQYFISFLHGKDHEFIREVPWWYSRPIPGWVEVVQEKKDKMYFSIIPVFYLDVHMWLSREKGNKITRGEVIVFFQNHVKEHFGRILEVVSNAKWEKMKECSKKNGVLQHEAERCDCVH